MADSTQVLREQAGIQYSGPQDKSEADPRDTLLTTIITGQFKRGRLDKPFMVTKANYRAKLGHDPKNLDYVAVEDALFAGAPFVWVMCLAAGKAAAGFSCAGATPSFHFHSFIGHWDIQVNNRLYINSENLNTDSFINTLVSQHPDFPISSSFDGFLDIFNEVRTETRVHLIPREGSATLFTVKEPQDNKAYFYDQSTGIFSFCLAAFIPPVIGVPQPG